MKKRLLPPIALVALLGFSPLLVGASGRAVDDDPQHDNAANASSPAEPDVVTYRGSEGPDPRFVEATIDPADVHVGDVQTMTLVLTDPAGVISVQAEIAHDLGTDTVELNRIFGEEAEGTWRGEWLVRHTHSATYHTTFRATNRQGQMNHITLAWTDPCAPPPGGNWTLDGNCLVSGVDGVDGGDFTVPSGFTLTIASGGVFVFNPGQQITMSGGDITVSTGGQIKKTYLWMTDSDGDGYGASTTQYAQDTAPLNGRRRSVMASTTAVDSDDTDGTCFQNLTCYVDGDNDTYTTGSAVTVCKATACNDPVGHQATQTATDCNDSDGARWRDRYTDSDSDSYCPNSAQTCVGNQGGYRDSCSAFTDCNDSDGARWRMRHSDADGDTYCPNTSQTCVGNQGGYVDSCASYTDCDDSDGARWRMRYSDGDGDTHCPSTSQTCVGNQGGYVDSCASYTDCDDGCGTCYVGSTTATASPDGIDQDCVDGVDNQVVTGSKTCTFNQNFWQHPSDHGAMNSSCAAYCPKASHANCPSSYSTYGHYFKNFSFNSCDILSQGRGWFTKCASASQPITCTCSEYR